MLLHRYRAGPSLECPLTRQFREIVHPQLDCLIQPRTQRGVTHLHSLLNHLNYFLNHLLPVGDAPVLIYRA